MNRDYRLTAKDHGIITNKVQGDDLTNFNIEYARFRSSWYTLAVALMAITGYG